MKCREVWNRRDEHFTLTEDEERYLRALERLRKMNPGRICLMANGRVSVRINEQWHDDNIDAYCSVDIPCEGGDGGDNF